MCQFASLFVSAYSYKIYVANSQNHQSSPPGRIYHSLHAVGSVRAAPGVYHWRFYFVYLSYVFGLDYVFVRGPLLHVELGVAYGGFGRQLIVDVWGSLRFGWHLG